MARYPQITRPCPSADRLDTVMDGSFCRHCRHEVLDLSELDEGGRTAALAARPGETCVSYRVPAAIAAGLMAIATPAAAQEPLPPPAAELPDHDSEIVVGGLPILKERRTLVVRERPARKAAERRRDRPAPAPRPR